MVTDIEQPGGGLAESAFAGDVAILPDGRVLAFGSVGRDPRTDLPSDAVLVRYLTDGDIDRSFGQSGRVWLTDRYGGAGPHGLELQHDGKIVAATYGARINRYHRGGTPDATFGSDGQVTLGSGFRSVAVAPEGGLVLAGGRACGFGMRVARVERTPKPTVVVETRRARLRRGKVTVRLAATPRRRVRGRITAYLREPPRYSSPLYGSDCPRRILAADRRFRIDASGRITLRLTRRANGIIRSERKRTLHFLLHALSGRSIGTTADSVRVRARLPREQR